MSLCCAESDSSVSVLSAASDWTSDSFFSLCVCCECAVSVLCACVSESDNASPQNAASSRAAASS